MQDRQQDGRIAQTRERVATRAYEVLSDLVDRPLSPGLYLVATPIGNLGDISLRALSVLARADLIAAEDTRHSRKLLTHFGVAGDLTPYHEHNAAKERPRLISRIKAGQSVALISDAGTPLISDPGYKLVREALDQGLMVTSVPGASATLAGLTVSGLPTDTFMFAGFLPPKSGPRKTRLEQMKDVPATLVFFEASSRLTKTLAEMALVLGPRESAVAKELTKLHETLARGTLDELAAGFATEDELKGEFVIVVAPPSPKEMEIGDAEILAELKLALKRGSFRDAVRDVAEARGLKRARVYELGLGLQHDDE